MKKSSLNWTIKQFKKMVEKGTISFDYPVQRAGEQWDLIQKSMLIHSLADGFPVPALYSTVDEKIYYILDGKQRLTNIVDFVNDKYALDEETPSAKIYDTRYELGGKKFSELDEEVQDELLGFSLQIYKIEEATDEEIEEMFFRLNNGTPLSKQQKAKAKMGTKWAKRIDALKKHPAMEMASFTKLQIRKADDETALFQTMMLLDEDYKIKSISSNDVFDYTTALRDDESKEKILEKIEKALDFIGCSFEIIPEKVLLKKVHFPMTILTTLRAIELGVTYNEFYDWKEEFKLALKDRSEDTTTNYKEFGGAGSVKKEKVYGRIEEMIRHMEDYVAKKFNRTPENAKSGNEFLGQEPSEEIDSVDDSVEVIENAEGSEDTTGEAIENTEETGTTEVI